MFSAVCTMMPMIVHTKIQIIHDIGVVIWNMYFPITTAAMSEATQSKTAMLAIL